MLEVRLLGQFEARQDGAAVVIPSRAAQSLFAYLLLTAGTAHRREKLAGLLWPDTADEYARKNLRHELWRLRKAIETKTPRKKAIPYLVIDEISIGFNAESDYWLDVALVQKSSSETEPADHLIETLSLYRGELLPGFYDEWIVLERERVRAVFEQKMARLLELLVEGKRWRDTLEWGEHWIAQGQTPEEAYRALMMAHGALSDVSQVASVYERCVRAMRDDLGVEPSEQTRVLYENLKTREGILAGPTISRTAVKQAFLLNIPVPLTSFIGRDKELKEIAELLSASRLVTLTGTGGVGKTRLAIQTAHDSLRKFEDGVCWVNLVGLSDATLIPQEIAQSLKVREVPNVPLVEMLKNDLKPKNLLLILDNCEHLIETAAQTAEQLLGACTKLKILATSRERLGIFNETVWRVPSLSENTSLQLFVERARAAQNDYSLADSNKRFIAQICERLDGIPLAIELAAARVAVLSTEEIAKHLDDRFSLLTAGSRTALPRQQTLRATIDWSHGLLAEPERILFRRLAVFAGGFTLQAAEAVCSQGELRQSDIHDLLGRLVDKSLVAVDIGTAFGVTRYRLLESIREYARDKAMAAGEWERLRDLHLELFQKFAESVRPNVDSPQERDWMARVEAEHDNLRAALEWGTRQNVSAVLQIADDLTLYWIGRGHEAEGHRWLTDALAQADKFPKLAGEAGRRQMTIRANALIALSWVIHSQGENARALDVTRQAENLARELEDERLLGSTLGQEAFGKIFLGDPIGVEELATESMVIAEKIGDKLAIGVAQIALGESLAVKKGDFNIARNLAEKGIALLKESGNRWLAALSIVSLGYTANLLNDHAEARQRFLDCLPMFQQMGDQKRANIAFSELAHIERYEGHYQKAALMYRETIQEWQRLNQPGAIARELECFAFIAKASEQVERAARLLGAAESLREKIEMPMSSFEHIEYDREVADLRANVDEKAIAADWAAGRAMSLEQAVAYALEESPSV